MILHPNCKINIGLSVLRRREDGYHDLSTVMYPVKGLTDTLELKKTPGGDVGYVGKGIEIDCPPEKNLCVKAYRLLRDRYPVGGSEMVLEKNIPFGAGLGGGSSDATSVLLGLDSLFGLGLEEEELIRLASELGSDTAFFVRNRPQMCEGRGEIMSDVEIDVSGLILYIVKPDEAVSTAEAYRGVRPGVPEVDLRTAVGRPVTEWRHTVKNDFEPSVFAAHPRIAECKERMYGAGAVYASMSGSGASVFGLFSPDVTLPDFPGLFTHKERL